MSLQFHWTIVHFSWYYSCTLSPGTHETSSYLGNILLGYWNFSADFWCYRYDTRKGIPKQQDRGRLFVPPFSPEPFPITELEANGIITIIIEILVIALLIYLVKSRSKFKVPTEKKYI